MSMTLQARLTAEEAEFVRRRTAAGQRPADVLHEAVACLRRQETRALMLEGYREMAAFNAELAEADMGSATEILPEW